MRFPFIRPLMPEPSTWIPYLECSYGCRRFSNFGPANELLKERIRTFINAPQRTALLAASGTSGLAAAIMGLGIEGRVAVPSFTFPATVHSVLMAGCVPVLCDVDFNTWELSPETIAPALSEGVRAVVHVRAFGLCRDLTRLSVACQAAGVPLIVDAAAALGGVLPSGGMAGCQGTAEVFSLHATKALGIGEGGVIVCHEKHHDRIARALNFGLGSAEFHRAMNGKLPEFAAAVGLAVLDRTEEVLKRRSAVAQRYACFFETDPELSIANDPGNPPWPCFPVLLSEGMDAAAVVEMARRRGLELRRYYQPPMHTVVPARLGISRPAPVSEALARRIVCLPVYSDESAIEEAEILQIMTEILPTNGATEKTRCQGA